MTRRKPPGLKDPGAAFAMLLAGALAGVDQRKMSTVPPHTPDIMAAGAYDLALAAYEIWIEEFKHPGRVG